MFKFFKDKIIVQKISYHIFSRAIVFEITTKFSYWFSETLKSFTLFQNVIFILFFANVHFYDLEKFFFVTIFKSILWWEISWGTSLFQFIVVVFSIVSDIFSEFNTTVSAGAHRNSIFKYPSRNIFLKNRNGKWWATLTFLVKVV